MIYHDVPQGSAEWLALRLGIPTASEFHNLITPAKGDRAKGEKVEAYLCRLIAERHLGAPLESLETEWMRRGSELEKRAATAYTLLTDRDTSLAGFITNDANTAGASLDRFVGDGRKYGLEIKCPSPGVHVSYLLNRSIEIDKRPQLQSQMWTAELDEMDIFSYHPEFPNVTVHVERDPEYIAKIAEYHAEFIALLEKRWTDFRSKL